MAKQEEQSDKKMWLRRGKLTFYGIIVAGIGFLIGLYLIAPMQAKSEIGYVPEKVKKMETAMVKFTHSDNGDVLLPVKITDENDALDKGLNNIGSRAWENTYLLFDEGDVTSWGGDFNVSKINTSLSFAGMDGEGEVVEIKEAEVGNEEVEIESDHRWVLIMETGAMNEYGIRVGSKLMTNTLPGSE